MKMVCLVKADKGLSKSTALVPMRKKNEVRLPRTDGKDAVLILDELLTKNVSKFLVRQQCLYKFVSIIWR